MTSPQALEKDQKIAALRKELCSWQNPSKKALVSLHIPLGEIKDHLPDGVFPTGAIHEFLSEDQVQSAATYGFIAALTGFLMQNEKPCVWVSRETTFFPPALHSFGIDPTRIFFIKAHKEKEAFWIIEEALKCEALGVVIGEIKNFDFAYSRRLQLAVAHSCVTGLIHQIYTTRTQPTASVARWKIRPLKSEATDDGLPGTGHPRWQVTLSKIRNGKPGCWQLEWSGHHFQFLPQKVTRPLQLKTNTA